jgi:3-hydroxyacyl-[acyl-carrier-protein] dehydratase
MRLENFQMLDGIETLDTEQASLVAVAHVPLHSPIFDGHFPGHPIMPGVLLLETMAQAAGYLLMTLNGFARMPFLASAKTANFRSFVMPGSTLKVNASRIHSGSGYAVMATSLECGGQCVSDAQLTMRIMAFPCDGLEQHVRREGQRLGFLSTVEAS